MGREQRMQSESEQQEGTRGGGRRPSTGGQEQSLSHCTRAVAPYRVWVWGGLQGRAAGDPCLLGTPCLAVPS